MKKKALSFALILSLVLTIALTAAPERAYTMGSAPGNGSDDPTVPIDQFHIVSQGIYRGARPGLAGLVALKRLGIKTSLNIDNDDEAIKEEREFAEALGIEMISEPMSGFFAPKDSQVDRALEALASPALRPIFVHCLHGQDRTGMVVGLYRVTQEGWKSEAAYEEALYRGFHRILFPLDHYFRERLGIDD